MGDLRGRGVQGISDPDMRFSSFPASARVLVTGGAGFLGRHVLAMLNDTGVRPVATRLPHETPPTRVPAAPGDSPAPLDADWRMLDLTDADAMRTLLRDCAPQYILHLAARMSGERSYTYAGEAFRANLTVTHALMCAAGTLCSGLERLVLIGSAEEYGNAPVLPITEDEPTAPISPYSASKAAATQYALLYHRLFGLPVTVLRPFIMYGPEQSTAMMLPQLIATALRGEDFPMTPGEQTRDFIHVGDVADAVLRAAVTPAAVGEVFNICSGTERSILSVAQQVLAVMESGTRLLVGAIPYRSNEAMRLVGNPDKAHRLLGWTPRIELAEGLRRTIASFRQQTVGIP